MNKLSKKIFSCCALFLGLFLASPIFAASGLSIDFQSIPLFNNANFLPGETAVRWVKVTNNTAETKYIATEAINYSGDDLSRSLNIAIKENGNALYSNTLFGFYGDGERYLSEIAPNASKEYDFEISFSEGAGNDWQGKTTSFDIVVGAQGSQSEGISYGAGGGGGNGGSPHALSIVEPLELKDLTDTSVTILWDTSYESTSRVIYGADPGQFSLSAGEPGYGYSDYTAEDISKVIHHEVSLTGLNPGTTYYYRCISHGSLAISSERSFTTSQKAEIQRGEVKGAYTEKDSREGEVYGGSGGAGTVEENNDAGVLDLGLKATIGETLNGFEDLWWLLAIVILILIYLYFHSIKTRAIERYKVLWILPLIIIGLFVIYYLYYPYPEYVISGIILISLLGYIAMMKKA